VDAQPAALELACALAAAVEMSPGVAIHAVDRAGCITYFNACAARLYGVPATDALGQPFAGVAERLGLDPAMEAELAACWDTGHVPRSGDWEVRLRDGSHRWLCASLVPLARQGRVEQLFCMEVDITARKAAEHAAHHRAQHDVLTGLPNRALFHDRLRQALASARRTGARVAMLYLDLDHFKAINDNHGHAAGDTVLREVAARLTQCVRSVDTVCRLGGDEFALLLANIGGAGHAAHVAGTVLQAVAGVARGGGADVQLAASIGIALFPGDGDDLDTLARHADMAMYHAKQQGRASYRFFSPAMNARVVERIALEESLRRALADGQFELEYAPEVDLASGLVTAQEALLRWRHPTRGRLLPEQFLAVAEECGLLVQIGAWVLEQACAYAQARRVAHRPLAVAVNLSPAQLRHPGLVAAVEAALAASGLPPQALLVEVTEAALHADADTAATVLDSLRARGVRMAIDDFGTGYCCLDALRRLAPAKLKIAPAFVAELGPGESGIVRAIIGLGHALQLQVVAEGVERADQLHCLRRLGCDAYQGRYANADARARDAAGARADGAA
jgi:diguanylate cyclase (GGDEF)-like protein/PAS domain S-box-containing protein